MRYGEYKIPDCHVEDLRVIFRQYVNGIVHVELNRQLGAAANIRLFLDKEMGEDTSDAFFEFLGDSPNTTFAFLEWMPQRYRLVRESDNRNWDGWSRPN